MGKRIGRLLAAAAILSAAAALAVIRFAGTEQPLPWNRGPQQAAAVRSAEAGQYQSEMSGAYAFVPTTDRVLSLALHGIGDLDGMMRLLDVLDESGTKATFFLPGMRLAEEPEIAREIADRGHELGNLTLNGLDMRGLDHERVYDEIHLANEVIWKAAGLFPRYVSTRNGEYTDDVRRAAAQLGMEAVIAGNLRIGARTAGEDLRSLIRSRMTRGGIIEVIVDQYPDPEAAVRAVVETAAEIGYELVTLSSLMAHQETLVRAEEIPGYDAAAIQPDYRRDAFRVVRKVQTDDRVVSLTFDDWGSDYTVTKTLDILERYGVKATFFLRAGGVEYNPNLARAIARAGHEVANHTYAHAEITKMTPEELQQDIVRAHRVLTEALQQRPAMLFRPPRREIDERTARVVAAAGYPVIVNYDVTAFDWDASRSAKDLLRTIREKTGPGSIIVLHILDDLSTIEALPSIIEYLTDQGYRFLTVSELLARYPAETEMQSS